MDMHPVEYVCFVAGKSGGHIVPALTLARRIKEESPQKKVVFFSTNSSLDQSIISRSQNVVDDHITLPLSSVSLKWYKLPFVGLKLAGALCKSLWQLMRFRPTSVTSIGGLVSLPVVCAAWMLRIPVTLYELNAVPGQAVTFLSGFAKRINVCFDNVATRFPHKTVKVDYPVRFSKNDVLPKSIARAQLAIPHDAQVVLVLGGSQGSHFLNTFVQSYVQFDKSRNPESPLFVIHQAGGDDVSTLRDFYHKMGVCARVFAFEPDLAPYYSAADCAISRAGAGSIFELDHFGVKTLLIPLEASTTDHQVDNAYAITATKSDLFRAVRQKDSAANPQAAYDLLDSYMPDPLAPP
jgi:UDP-N-acetylglucosamine--N-acetylmuramyl-(pentapeptide) pyrophosphoryl-undecaprenol N-acetylglucosamine transferase